MLVEVKIQSFLAFTTRGRAVINFSPYPVYARGNNFPKPTREEAV
jgi:hypothetical protein